MIIRSIVIVIVLIVTAVTLSPAFEKVDSGGIQGTWTNNSLEYTFDSQGTMSVVKAVSESAVKYVYSYKLLSMGEHTIIRFWKDPADSLSSELMLVCDANDSSAVFVRGIPFVRAGPGNSVFGTWKHIAGLSIMSWIISRETIDYSHVELDLKTGEFYFIEERHGVYTRGAESQRGRFFIAFQDGKKAVVLPIVFKDVLFMFDLNPRRATFFLSATVPAVLDSISTSQESHHQGE